MYGLKFYLLCAQYFAHSTGSEQSHNFIRPRFVPSARAVWGRDDSPPFEPYAGYAGAFS
jgi:hypothetical protein